MFRRYPETADGDALQRFADDGNEMGQPMCIDFHLDMANEDIADICLTRLSARKFTADKHEEDDGRWTVTVPVIMIPDYDEIVYFQEVLNKDLNRFGAETDGWGSFGNLPENLPDDLKKALYP